MIFDVFLGRVLGGIWGGVGLFWVTFSCQKED
jgi:hypothetical protein